MKIRRGSILTDSAELLQLLIEMHRLFPSSSHFTVHLGKAAQTIAHVLSSGSCFVVVDENQSIVGSIGGYISNGLWYSETRFLGDTWFFVHPAHRASPAAVNLVDAFIADGVKAGVPVQLAHIAGDDLDRKDKFFQRKGLVKMGSVFFFAPPEAVNG